MLLQLHAPEGGGLDYHGRGDCQRGKPRIAHFE
ncbi:MAG: hypothetical protein ACJAQT_004921 [Akkermansiaceae bacterium]|jgi:hypothetical protein